ncbi:MAG TPA: nuclear transport factor 2 family protein [Solirubrobacteraceae bacterium]|nr:nuclear transport factor 2 family protein [Solirubrobacteraceae bacterium]
MTDLPAPITAALDAANAHDTDAFLATFTPDGVVDDWGREFRGADAIRGWSDREFIGVDVTLAVTGTTTDGTATTVAAEVGGRGFNGPSHFTFALDGDRVARMTIRA